MGGVSGAGVRVVSWVGEGAAEAQLGGSRDGGCAKIVMRHVGLLGPLSFGLGLA